MQGLKLKQHKGWSDEDIAALRRELKDRTALDEIARRLDRTMAGVQAKVAKLRREGDMEAA